MKTDEIEYGAFEPVKVQKDIRKANKTSIDKKNDDSCKKSIVTEKTESGVSSEIPADTSKKNQTKNNQKTKRKTDSAAAIMKVRYSIGLKLILIISAIIAISLGTVTFLVSHFVSADTRVSAEENNLTINSRAAADSQTRLQSLISSVGLFYDTLSLDDENEEMQNKAARFFERSKEVVAMYFVYDDYHFINNSYFLTREIDTSLITAYLNQEDNAVSAAKNGETLFENATPFFSDQIMAAFTPIRSDDNDDVVMILFSMESMSESFSSGSVNLSFMVNGDGLILVHPDLELMNQAADFSSHYLVKELVNSKNKSEQITYKDENGIEYIGAYTKLDTGNCSVVTEVQTAVILEAVNTTTRRNIYLTIAILSIVIIIVWFFSKSLSEPLKELTVVANEINSGNFETSHLSQMKNKRSDEIGVLIESTKAEQDILNTFTRLTNKGVTRAIVTKKIDFQPHLKDITIFFSDIRGFTAISDGFNNRFGEKSAAEIIGFLNDYMARMVNCITITGGTVDKFEGDAIMACWGVLRDDSLDYEKWPDTDPRKKKFRAVHEKHVKHDALSAIKATIGMRYALMEYNKKAEAFTKKHEGEPMAKYKPHIRIGSGLNSGRATVGFMGSYDKMEFTSIGDAVNLASRTESSNKPCGTDMLITEDTYNLLKMDFIRCEENNFTIKPENLKNEVIVEVIPVTFEVKGKGKQHFYGVVNMPQFNIEEFFRKTNPNFKLDQDCAKSIGPKGPKTLAEVRTLLGIPTPDFGGVNLDAEESKIKAT